MGTYEYKYENDNNDQLVTKIINDGVSMNIEYDLLGNSIQTVLKNETETTQLPIVSSAAYSDDGSQLASQTDTNGYTTSYDYNQKRLAAKVTNNAGTVTQTTYYDSDRVKTTYISGTVSLLHEYKDGLLEKITRGGYIPGTAEKQNQVYTMAYDAFGNNTSIKVGNITLATYAYGSANNHLDSMSYGNGDTVEYVYDNLDRLVAEIHTDHDTKDKRTYQFFYNSDGNLAKILDVERGEAVNYEYDSLGRLIHSWESQNGEIELKTEHLYDTSNRLTQQSWQMEGTVHNETYEYNTGDGSLHRVESSGGIYAYEYKYDKLKRLEAQYNWVFRQNYSYRDFDSDDTDTVNDRTTTQVAQLDYVQQPGGTGFDEFTLRYTYDNLGNIQSEQVDDENPTVYTYDAQGQLLKTDDNIERYTYSYDTYGNIRSKEYHYYVAGYTQTDTYEYSNTDWLDLLTAYNGQPIAYEGQTYDATTNTVSGSIKTGNPISYYNGTRWEFDWSDGRKLVSAESDDVELRFQYDQSGIRSSKTVDGVVHNYIYASGKLMRETYGENVLDFFYDSNGRPYAFKYNGTLCYYVLNLQGDVIRLVSVTGATVQEYKYDAWGEPIGSVDSVIGKANPLRYRGYYYDSDTGFYYLQSRYYDPSIGRFISADNPSYIGINGAFTSYNLFAYCGNSPVSRLDSGGSFWDTVFDLVSIATDVVEIAANPGSVMAWGALAADVASLVVPGLTGGGQLVRVVTSSDDILDAAKYADDIFDGAKQFFGNSDIGKAMHKFYDPIQDAVTGADKLLNQALGKYGSRLRPDGVDFTNRIIYELKPYNKRSFKRATKQAKKYADILGGEWTIVIDMYMK